MLAQILPEPGGHGLVYEDVRYVRWLPRPIVPGEAAEPLLPHGVFVSLHEVPGGPVVEAAHAIRHQDSG